MPNLTIVANEIHINIICEPDCRKFMVLRFTTLVTNSVPICIFPTSSLANKVLANVTLGINKEYVNIIAGP
jgi:hypothetical protein